MTWFKVDDTLSNHPKARAAGLPAMGLWVVAGAYASQYLTEGFVPDSYVASWPNGRKHAAALVAADLWMTVDNGWRFHQWDERNPSKDQVEAKRAANRERQRRRRESRQDNDVSHGVTPPVSHNTPTRPDPTVVPTELPSGPRKRATRIPDPFEIGPDMRAWADTKGYNSGWIEQQTERFVNYWSAKSGKDSTKLDWPATWRNWLLKSADDFTATRRNISNGIDWEAQMRMAEQRERNNP